jgi:hypothetical protein
MFLFSYYKMKVLIRLTRLFLINVLRRTTQYKCVSVNSAYTVRKSKYEQSIYLNLVVNIVTRLGCHRGVFDVRRLFLTPTRRVSWYPRRVIKGSVFPADYSLVVTCMGS